MKYIATISFGKDSTVMGDLLLKNGYQVDAMIFTDTLLELPLMYDYKKKVENYFKLRYGVDVITTKPNTTFEEWCFGTIKGENVLRPNYIRGIPEVWSMPCYWRRESKLKPIEKLAKELFNGEEYTTYIGFTTDESQRRMKDEGKFLYPLIDDFKMSERNCQEYLINKDMENPLYRFFDRTGCGMCPAQSKRAWHQVWKYFKETWEYMEWVEKRLIKYESMGMNVVNCHWFKDNKTCAQMEEIFIKAEKQGTLFDLSDEPLKDCFCKI